ncbi:hypothetical protein JW824_03135 [bacterium]|nr:hypothetical protein [bacterium]RQV98041.1 MAG: hypothetical protein EH221_02780 [bacterium]
MKTLMVINTIVSLIFGIAFVLVPDTVVSLYGVVSSPQLLYIGQLFGAALIGYGVLTWLVRNTAVADARKAILPALFIADSIGFIVAIIGQIRWVVNALGWSIVAIYLLFALGFGSFLIKKKTSSSS